MSDVVGLVLQQLMRNCMAGVMEFLVMYKTQP